MCWRGPDADEMDDRELGCHARGMLKCCGSGVGSDFQCRPQAVTVRGPAWVLIDQAWGVMVGRSNAEGGVRKGAAQRAASPGRSRTDFARASRGGDAG